MDATNQQDPILRKRPPACNDDVLKKRHDSNTDAKIDLPVPPTDTSPSIVATKDMLPETSAKPEAKWDFNIPFNELMDIFADWRAQLDTTPPPRRYGFTPLEQWRIYGTLVFYFNMIPLFFLGVYTIFVCGTTVISAVFIQGSLVILGTFISLPFFVAMSVVGLAVGMVIVVIGHFFETETLKNYTPRFLKD